MSEEKDKKRAAYRQDAIVICIMAVFVFGLFVMQGSDPPQQPMSPYGQSTEWETQHGNGGSAGQPNFSGFSVSIPRVDETTQRMAEGRHDWNNDQRFQRHMQRINQQMENLQRIDGPRRTDL